TPAPSKADVFGYVSLYDDGINKLDNSGMKVYVDGAEDIFSATTDSEGNFTIKDVTLGTYGIVYEKEGYGTYKIYNVKLEKAGESVSIEKIPSLGKLSTTKVTSLSSRIEGEDVMLTYDTDPAGNSNAPRYIRYFFDDEAGVTSSTYKHHTVVYEIKDSPHERWFSTENLKDLGFKSGETVYVKVCGDSFWSNDYDEPSFGIRLFPNLNMTSADEVSFVIP
ncbi:MAG: carboxypeptidase regulatory-like domain-containing protein, partial [Flavobacteriales bacterium]|nr:carboxypeptidase regulatory-like domain-containing protein [Flavobacteriales bacterium]